jgi:hypothetical protein
MLDEEFTADQLAAHVPEHVHSTGWIDSSSSPSSPSIIHLQHHSSISAHIAERVQPRLVGVVKHVWKEESSSPRTTNRWRAHSLMSWPPCHRNRRGGTHDQTITELDKWNVIDLAYYTMQAHPFAAPRPPFPRHLPATPPNISNMFGEPTNISHSGRQSALRTYDRVKDCDVKHVKHVPRCLDRRHGHGASSLIL